MKFIELTGADRDPISVRVDRIVGFSPQNHAPPNGFVNPPWINGTAITMENIENSFWAREHCGDVKSRIMQAISSDNPGFY